MEFVDTCVGPIEQLLHTLVGHIIGNPVGVHERHTGQWKFASCTGWPDNLVTVTYKLPLQPRQTGNFLNDKITITSNPIC